MGAKVEYDVEKRNRIRLSMWAYAYEYESVSLVTDEVFDKVARSIDVSKETGNKQLDKFFQEEFAPHTGMWIHKHPDLSEIRLTYHRLFKFEKCL